MFCISIVLGKKVSEVDQSWWESAKLPGCRPPPRWTGRRQLKESVMLGELRVLLFVLGVCMSGWKWMCEWMSLGCHSCAGLICNVRDNDIIRHHMSESPGVNLWSCWSQAGKCWCTGCLKEHCFCVMLEYVLYISTNVYCQYCPRREGLRCEAVLRSICQASWPSPTATLDRKRLLERPLSPGNFVVFVEHSYMYFLSVLSWDTTDRREDRCGTVLRSICQAFWPLPTTTLDRKGTTNWRCHVWWVECFALCCLRSVHDMGRWVIVEVLRTVIVARLCWSICWTLSKRFLLVLS